MKLKVTVAMTYIIVMFALAFTVDAHASDGSVGVGSPSSAYSKKHKRAQRKYIQSKFRLKSNKQCNVSK